ncbi:hypothetical protein FACS18945_5060 [Bacteroidia bacterium]|nr:hypothetical protein FACS18945_5060 [Bacteroidia bacterium]
MAFAQDVITLKSGNEIQALVQEIGIDEVKYKKYDNQEGPSYTLKKSEIFMIKYANGSKDVFANEPAPAKKTEQKKQDEIYSAAVPAKEKEPQKTTGGRTYKKNAFGLDFGVGSMSEDNDQIDLTGFDFSLRYTHYFMPYIGADFIKFNQNFGTGDYQGTDVFCAHSQFMTGIRGASPQFANNRMHVFGAFRFGLGVNYYDIGSAQEALSGAGFCYEFELGIHLTRTLWLGLAYNYQGGTAEYDAGGFDVDNSYVAFKLGFNFGANTPYNK